MACWLSSLLQSSHLLVKFTLWRWNHQIASSRCCGMASLLPVFKMWTVKAVRGAFDLAAKLTNKTEDFHKAEEPSEYWGTVPFITNRWTDPLGGLTSANCQ